MLYEVITVATTRISGRMLHTLVASACGSIGIGPILALPPGGPGERLLPGDIAGQPHIALRGEGQSRLPLRLDLRDQRLHRGVHLPEDRITSYNVCYTKLLRRWGVFVQPLGFVLFLTALFAEANRTPFDLPEGESELVAGFHTEYGSFKFSMFMMAEYFHMVVGAFLTATLFFGGWQFPYLADAGFVLPFGISFGVPAAAVLLLRIGALFAKVVFFAWLFIWVRWTIPRFRYDQA